MSTFWLTLLRIALSLAVKAIGQIPEEQWAKLSEIIVGWLEAIQRKLPAGSPALTVLHAYRAPASKLTRPHENPSA